MRHKAEEKRRAASGQRVTRSIAAASSSSSLSVQLSLPYAVFEQVLFDYQLQGRIKLLEDFRVTFERFDTERVGIVSQVRRACCLAVAVAALTLKRWTVACRRRSSASRGK